jgi:hypothetical protein
MKFVDTIKFVELDDNGNCIRIVGACKASDLTEQQERK